MFWSLIILFIIILVGAWVILKFTSLNQYVPESIRPYFGLSTSEKFSKPILKRSKLPIDMRFSVAIKRALDTTLHLINKYVVNLPSAERKSFIDNVRTSITDFKNQSGEIEITTEGANIIVNAIKSFGIPLIEKISGADAAAEFASDIETKVRSITNNVINFTIESNPLSIANIVQGPVMDKVMDFHFNRNEETTQQRLVKPYQKKGPKKDINLPSKDPILGLIHNDFPSISNSQSLLPSNGEPMNLEIANLIAANRRYYQKPESIVMDRGADPRPLPKPLVDMIVSTNGKNPNSLERSTAFDPIDILESSRGEAGSEYINTTLEKLYKESDKPFIKDFDAITKSEIDKSSNFGNLLRRGQTDLIISDIKLGYK